MRKVHKRDLGGIMLARLDEPIMLVHHKNKVPLAVVIPLPTPENIERLVAELRDMAEGER